MKSFLRKLWWFSKRYREPYNTLWKINYELPSRSVHSKGQIKLGRWDVEYVDPNALASMWKWQFDRRTNDFFSTTDAPKILDCGSNIGVSVMRFKELYPNAQIIAFEPDPTIYTTLVKNIEANAIEGVQTVNVAIWKEVCELKFASNRNDDSQSGHIEYGDGDTAVNADSITVKAVWLGEYLREPVDFVKLDVEGAELIVLESCVDLLHNIDQMMIEVHYHIDKPDFLIQIISILKDAGFRIAIYESMNTPIRWKPFIKVPTAVADQFPIIWASRK